MLPDFSIIDTHVHLWDPKFLRYPWLDEVVLLNKPYLLDDYNQATQSLNIEQMVFVQCECEPAQCMEEAVWVSELAKSDQRIRGIVPWAPLEQGDGVRDVLERYAENPLIKGVRRIIQFEPDPDFCLQPTFVQGVRMLADYDFTFDICISHGQLQQVLQLIKQCPHVRFILDHAGKPDIKNGLFQSWYTDIQALAALEHVQCKLSGLVTEANHNTWKLVDLKPYVEGVLESFGTDRVLFGGDWPVVYQAASYARWIETLDILFSGLSSFELQQIYYDNAIHFYQLK